MMVSQLKSKVARIQNSFWYTAGIILLCLIAVTLVVVELTWHDSLSSEFLADSLRTDFIISLVFLADYLVAFWVSPKKLAYVFSLQGFFSLISSIPLTDTAYRALRIFRLARFIRLIRLFQATTEGQQIIARRNGTTIALPSDRLET